MGETQSVQEVMRTFAGNFCAHPADIALTCAPQTSDQFLVINFLLASGFEKASFLSVLARDEGVTRFFFSKHVVFMCISCDELFLCVYHVTNSLSISICFSCFLLRPYQA